MSSITIHILLCLQISNWTKFISTPSNEVFALVLKNVKGKLSNKQKDNLKSSISNNYPDVMFNLLYVKSLNTFEENIQKIVKGIDGSAIVGADNISEHDLVAIASGPKYKAVS